MSGEQRTIEIHIVMTEDGHFVVDEDADAAVEKADDEFPDDDVRQVALTIKLQPPSKRPMPIAASVEID